MSNSETELQRSESLENIVQVGESIEDIYFFEVNTKFISSSVLKTSEFI